MVSRGRVEHDLYSWTTWESQLGAFIEKGGESFQKGRRMDTCSTLGGVQASHAGEGFREQCSPVKATIPVDA